MLVEYVRQALSRDIGWKSQTNVLTTKVYIYPMPLPKAECDMSIFKLNKAGVNSVFLCLVALSRLKNPVYHIIFT